MSVGIGITVITSLGLSRRVCAVGDILQICLHMICFASELSTNLRNRCNFGRMHFLMLLLKLYKKIKLFIRACCRIWSQIVRILLA